MNGYQRVTRALRFEPTDRVPVVPELIQHNLEVAGKKHRAFSSDPAVMAEVILAGRRINDGMGRYIAGEIVKLMIKKMQSFAGAKVLQLGITFKENCSDIRNSRAADLAHSLQDFGCRVDVFDPWADPDEVKSIYDLISSRRIEDLSGDGYDAIVLAVAVAG